MPIVLSFDVGMSNLAYCIVRDMPGEANPCAGDLSFEIVGWEVIDLKASCLDEACRNLPRELFKRIDTMSAVDRVVIERQTKSNIKMKCMSHAIQTFFETHLLCKPRPATGEFPRMSVDFVSPCKKLGVYTGPPVACKITNPYRRNKRLAIEHTTKILERYPVHVEYFHQASKKDDLADALLHALVTLRDDPKRGVREVDL